ncbi:MAG: hypothetical protein K0Q47_91 [Sedimentibacter sp.]|jgi:ATP-dependent DNA ligase|nr:hypothetical protein [Sedimentibacter sp.]
MAQKIVKAKSNLDLLSWRPFIPMGAVKEPLDKLDAYIDNPDYIAEIKYDGYRMPSWFYPDVIRFTTRSIGIETVRNGSPWPTERTDNIPHLKILKHNHYGTMPDGEIWKPNSRSHDMTSMIGGLPETSLNNQIEKGFVHYMMYDIIQYKGKDLRETGYSERRKILEDFYHEMLHINRDWYFEHPVTKEILCNNIEDYLHISQIVSFEDRREIWESIVAAGGEGMVLKHKDSLYYEGKIRDGKGEPAKVKANKKKGIPFTPWVKWKKYDTFDVVIKGFEPATVEYTGKDPANHQYWMSESGHKFLTTGSEEAYDRATSYGEPVKPITKFHFYGWIGSIIFGQYKGEELIEVGNTSGITDEMREEFTKNPDKYIGLVAEVGAMERVPKTGALREPRFLRIRDDKNAFECIIE